MTSRQAGSRFTASSGARESVTAGGWRIEGSEGPILGLPGLLALSKKLGNPYQSEYPLAFCVPGSLGTLKPCSCGSALVMGVRMHLPEAVWGNNWVRLTHEASGTLLRFDTDGALLRWVLRSLKHGCGGIKVAVAKEGGWLTRYPAQYKTQDYDWTYSTDYRGGAADMPTGEGARGAMARKDANDDAAGERDNCGCGGLAEHGGGAVCAGRQWQPSGPGNINMALLQDHDAPILFYRHLVLYEDFLHDNGVVQLSLKVRVMPTCWLLLLRHWLRVDGVLTRISDTRVFHEFGSPHIVREHSVKEIRELPRPTFQRELPLGTMPGVAPQQAGLPGSPDGPGGPTASFADSGRLGTPMAYGPPAATTADEAAEQLRHAPEMQTSYELLPFAATMQETAEVHTAPTAKMALGAPASWRHSLDDYVECLVVDRERGMVAASSLEGQILVADVQGKLLHCFDGHTGGTLSLAFCGGGILASSGEDGTLRIWNTSDASPARAVVELEGVGADYCTVGGRRLSCVQLVTAGFASSSRHVAVAAGRAAYVVEFEEDWGSAQATAQLPALRSTITALQTHAPSSSLLAACYGGVTLWADLGRGPARHLSYEGPLLSLAVAPAGLLVAAGCQDETLHLWQLGDDGAARDFSCGGYLEKVTLAICSACGRYLVSAGGMQPVLWRLEDEAAPEGDESRAALVTGHAARVASLALSAADPDGVVWLASGAEDGAVLLHKLGDAEYERPGNPNLLRPWAACPLGDGGGGSVSCLAWVGQTLIAGTSDGDVVGWDRAALRATN
jgi:WD40 repeat protein